MALGFTRALGLPRLGLIEIVLLAVEQQLVLIARALGVVENLLARALPDLSPGRLTLASHVIGLELLLAGPLDI